MQQKEVYGVIYCNLVIGDIGYSYEGAIVRVIYFINSGGKVDRSF